MTVFADTFALIAWLNRHDSAHQLVTDYLDRFTGQLLMTEWVLMEVADALSAPEARATAVSFLTAVRADVSFEVVGYDTSSASTSGPAKPCGKSRSNSASSSESLNRLSVKSVMVGLRSGFSDHD